MYRHKHTRALKIKAQIINYYQILPFYKEKSLNEFIYSKYFNSLQNL